MCCIVRTRGGGAITAALYLSEFITPVSAKNTTNSSEDKDLGKVTKTEEKMEASSSLKTEEGDKNISVEEKSTSTSSESAPTMVWFHVDFMGSKGSSAEPQGMRAVYEYIKAGIIKSNETDIK